MMSRKPETLYLDQRLTEEVWKGKSQQPCPMHPWDLASYKMHKK